MTDLHRVRMVWTGFSGAPGVSTFYALNGADLLEPLHDMFAGLSTVLPTVVALQIENSGDVIDDVTGNLVGTWAGDAQASIDCSGAAVYSPHSGGLIRWWTTGVMDGHRLTGKTYVVPLDGGQYTAAGVIHATAAGYLSDAGETLLATNPGNMYIWHRPRAARAADGSRPAVEQRDGDSLVVTGASASNKVVTLRSRRD